MDRFFNNSGSSIMSDKTVETITKHLELEKEYGGYKAANLVKNEIDNFYVNASKLINSSSSEIAYVDSASRAWSNFNSY